MALPEGRRITYPILPDSPSKSGEVYSRERRNGVLEVGSQAPDFEVPAVTGDRRHRVRLSDFRGRKNVVLAFYPLDWTPT